MVFKTGNPGLGYYADAQWTSELQAVGAADLLRGLPLVAIVLDEVIPKASCSGDPLKSTPADAKTVMKVEVCPNQRRQARKGKRAPKPNDCTDEERQHVVQ